MVVDTFSYSNNNKDTLQQIGLLNQTILGKKFIHKQENFHIKKF